VTLFAGGLALATRAGGMIAPLLILLCGLSLLWAIFPFFLYRLTRVWLLAARGVMQEDPVSFAIRDRVTWLIVAICRVILKLASL